MSQDLRPYLTIIARLLMLQMTTSILLRKWRVSRDQAMNVAKQLNEIKDQLNALNEREDG